MPTLPRPALHRLFAGLAGVVLVVSGCGGGGGGGGRAAASPPTIPVSTTTPPPGQPQLRAIVVQQGDLPGGWISKPSSHPAAQAASGAAFAQCVGSPDTATGVDSVAYSPDFVNGSSYVTSTATSYRGRAEVQADTAALVNPRAAACLEQVGKPGLAASLAPGETVKSDSIKITPGTNGGPANIVATVVSTVTIAKAGHDVTLIVDSVEFTAPRIEAHVDFYSEGNAFPAAVKTAVLAAVSQRVTFGS